MVTGVVCVDCLSSLLQLPSSTTTAKATKIEFIFIVSNFIGIAFTNAMPDQMYFKCYICFRELLRRKDIST
ncbi:hypothetical protein D3C81_1312660 [compost metagenome]